MTGRPAASVTRTRVSAGLSVSLKTKLRAGVRFALEQVRELGLWMLLGVLLGTAVEMFIPEDTFTHYLGGSSLLGLVAALVVAGLFPAQDPARVLAALKTVTAAWDEGKVILQRVGPLQASKDEYLTLRVLDRWFQAPARTRLFPTPLPA